MKTLDVLNIVNVTAGWANAILHKKNRWRTSSRYAVLQKTLI
jgi:hypothetical protein